MYCMLDLRAHTLVAREDRCFARNGQIGHDFPPQIRHCLSRIARNELQSDVVRVHGHYKDMATTVRSRGGRCCYTHATCMPAPLQARAQQLLELGF